MDPSPTAAARTFALPELLDRILTYLLTAIHPIGPHQDPRSAHTHANAAVLQHLLNCTLVSRAWHANITASPLLQQALFLRAAPPDMRSWTLPLLRLEGSYSMLQHLREIRAPVLNPLVQTTFPRYQFRFWHLSPEVNGNRYCAYLILTREDVAGLARREGDGRGRNVVRMLLSQPPVTALEATIWEERDETREYVGRTKRLREPVVRCEAGVTIGMVQARVAAWMAECQDVAAIKLTTV